MNDTTNGTRLAHHFLIAMPEMADPIFAGTVTYIHTHDDQGALGFIVNRPIKLNLGDVLDSAELKHDSARIGKRPVYHGGPVQTEQGFILHKHSERHWQDTITNDELCITASKDMLEAIAEGAGPEQFLFCLGYSGWSAGQLEEELRQNAWLTVEAENDIIFSMDEEGKYKAALTKLGIDPTFLSGHGGMA